MGCAASTAIVAGVAAAACGSTLNTVSHPSAGAHSGKQGKNGMHHANQDAIAGHQNQIEHERQQKEHAEAILGKAHARQLEFDKQESREHTLTHDHIQNGSAVAGHVHHHHRPPHKNKDGEGKHKGLASMASISQVKLL